MKIKYYFLLIFTLINVPLTNAQSVAQRRENAENQIQLQLFSQYDGYFKIECIADMDSLKCSNWIESGLISDPYNTLNRCFPFVARLAQKDGVSNYERIISTVKGYKDSITIFGIYGDGKIKWMESSLQADKDYIGEIYGISDINNDGKAEIMLNWKEAYSNADYSILWIFSWNGSTGTQIFEKRENSFSKIENVYKVIDLNGDGIMELIGKKGMDPENRTEVTYSWNGSLYGNWPNAPKWSEIKFTPAYNINIKTKSYVTRYIDSLVYSYTISNNQTSRNDMKYFFLQDGVKSIRGVPVSGWNFNRSTMHRVSIFLTLNKNFYLKKGSSLEGFTIKSTGIPSIFPFYAQSEFNVHKLSNLDKGNMEETVIKNMYTNSFKGLTIGPADPPNPFIPINFLDTLTSYTTQSRSLEWIKDQATADKYLGYFNSAKTSLAQNNKASTRATLNQVLQDANIDSTSNITSEAYALICYNTEYLLSQLPTTPAPAGCNVKLVNSTGTKLTGGTLQYYDSSWKDAVNNNDGTFFVNTTKTSLSLRMTYEYGTQAKSNVSISSDTVIFQTVNAQVQLQNSSGVLIDTGTVKYYAGAWRDLGTTVNGIASKELLANNYSFRMTYAYASKDKQQDLNTNPTVVFQTVNAAVQLQNSQGNLIDQGTVQYYSGAWREFGSTSNGVANKELLPNNYSFRMTYAYASKDKQQDLSTNPTVVFQTVNAQVQLKNSQGALIDQGTVQYYSGAWRTFGTTTNGVASKELLPNNYSFRITYAYGSKDKQQDLNTNPTVVFQTVNATVQLQNSQGALIDQGTVQYYSGAWRTLGTTTNGIANKELLPNNYSFRMTYESASVDKQQDLSVNNVVGFSTVLCMIRVKNTQNEQIDGATASYYSGAWREIGLTVNGEITKELLPLNLSFRVKFGTQQQDKQQNLSTNNIVEFIVE